MWSGYYRMHMQCLLFILTAVQVTVWKMAASNILRPCLWRFITLHHDPLAQQTSCLKCLSGLTPRVWIPEFVCYVICLRERCGLSFFFFSPLFLLSTPCTYLRLSVFINQCIRCRFHCDLQSGDSDFDGFAWFLNWDVQIGEKKIDSHVLCTCPSGSERLWKHIVSTSQTAAASCFICGLCRYFVCVYT